MVSRKPSGASDRQVLIDMHGSGAMKGRPMFGFFRDRNWRVFATVAVVIVLAGVQYLILIR
jgi:hypothetical protein